MARVSTIIVNYNTGELTKSCLQSVFEKTVGVDFDVYVVDNASPDGSADAIAQAFPQVTVIRNSENAGFARANNAGIRASKGDYVFLLNPDTLLVNNAIRIFLDFMDREENSAVACSGGSLFDGAMAPQVTYGNFPSLAEVAFKVFRLKKIFPGYYRRNLRSSTEVSGDGVRRVDYVVGADMFLRRSSLEKTGLLDEDFFLYFEDTELCYRIARHGFSSVVVPEARIIHLAAQASAHASKLEKVAIREKSRFLFFRKCYGKKVALLIKTLYILKEIERLLTGFKKRNWEMARIIARS